MSFDYHPSRALTETEVQAMRDGKASTANCAGDVPAQANKDNDYLIDAPRGGRNHL